LEELNEEAIIIVEAVRIGSRISSALPRPLDWIELNVRTKNREEIVGRTDVRAALTAARKPTPPAGK
jgi:hypothetical protein